MRGGGEDFGQGGGIVGGVQRRRSRNFRCHGSPAERTYAGDLRRGPRRKRSRASSCARAFYLCHFSLAIKLGAFGFLSLASWPEQQFLIKRDKIGFVGGVIAPDDVSTFERGCEEEEEEDP